MGATAGIARAGCSLHHRAARLVHSRTSIWRYAELSGRDVSQISYYEVLGIFKLAVILQQIYFRFRRAQTTDKRFENFGLRVAGAQ